MRKAPNLKLEAPGNSRAPSWKRSTSGAPLACRGWSFNFGVLICVHPYYYVSRVTQLAQILCAFANAVSSIFHLLSSIFGGGSAALCPSVVRLCVVKKTRRTFYGPPGSIFILLRAGGA